MNIHIKWDKNKRAFYQYRSGFVAKSTIKKFFGFRFSDNCESTNYNMYYTINRYNAFYK